MMPRRLQELSWYADTFSARFPSPGLARRVLRQRQTHRKVAEGVGEGLPVGKGDVIGYVEDTGNVAPGDYHLHFSVAILSDPARWWEGENLNPYTLLTGAAREP